MDVIIFNKNQIIISIRQRQVITKYSTSKSKKKKYILEVDFSNNEFYNIAFSIRNILYCSMIEQIHTL